MAQSFNMLHAAHAGCCVDHLKLLAVHMTTPVAFLNSLAASFILFKSNMIVRDQLIMMDAWG